MCVPTRIIMDVNLQFILFSRVYEVVWSQAIWMIVVAPNELYGNMSLPLVTLGIHRERAFERLVLSCLLFEYPLFDAVWSHITTRQYMTYVENMGLPLVTLENRRANAHVTWSTHNITVLANVRVCAPCSLVHSLNVIRETDMTYVENMESTLMTLWKHGNRTRKRTPTWTDTNHITLAGITC